MRHFTPKDLQNHLHNGQSTPLLLDVREPWEYDICHLTGSELVPMRKIQQVAEAFDKNREIVVICHHGIRSRHVAYYLEQIGFNNVINLEGGVERWANEIDPTMKRY